MIGTTATGRSVIITLDRAARRNALDTVHCQAVITAVRDAVSAGRQAIVLTGSGSSFCAGADLDVVHDAQFRVALYSMIRTIIDAPVPVIAAVNGPAVGAGAQLAVACDLRVAAESAFFAIPTAKNGLAVDAWTVRRLRSLSGSGTTAALLLGAEQISSEVALARGLVDRLGSIDDAMAWAEAISALAPMAVGYAKSAIHQLDEDADHDDRLAAGFDACWTSDDVREARIARAQGRAPRFHGA